MRKGAKGMHNDKEANVQLCQSVWGQMSIHIIFQRGANVQGGTCPALKKFNSEKQTGINHLVNIFSQYN